MKAKILADIQICISVPLRQDFFMFLENELLRSFYKKRPKANI